MVFSDKCAIEFKLGFDAETELVFLLGPLKDLHMTYLMDYYCEFKIYMLKMVSVRYHYW